MADTRQVVSWCLEFQCKLRTGRAETQPGAALMQTARARYFSRNQFRRGEGAGVYGDVYVTGHTARRGGSDNTNAVWRSYPSDGYIISKEFALVGGIEGLRGMCAACPANATPDLFAGCSGTLVYNFKNMEAELQSILSQSNLAQACEAAFLKTTPLWYGLWAESPLSGSALRAVRVLFSEWLNGKQASSEHPAQNNDDLRQFSEFIRATEIAEESGLNLPVSFSPPGHTDFGFYTIFPHCPRCKAAADVKRWQRHYPISPYMCRVCGKIYSPAETASSTRMEDDGSELREILGQSEFEAFAKDYLVTLGASENEALQVVASSEDDNRKRQLKLAATRRQHELTRKYVVEELCRDLKARPPDDYHGDYPPWFEADNFVKLMQRCEQIRADIAYMHHENESGDLDRNIARKRVPGGIDDPSKVLKTWLDEGCNGWFTANIIVPDHFLDTQ